MDNLSSDPPPISFSPPPHITTPSFSLSTVNLPAHSRPLTHPSYEDMIKRAIIALNEKEGSSRQKIAKYIENEFHLPQSSSHTSELTQQLRKMKNYGQLVLVRHSYLLPSTQAPPSQVFAVSDGPKRKPGRPPKLQPIVGPAFVSPSPTQTPSPVGFAAFSPKQLGVPTTNLFAGLTPAYHQFGPGPVSTTGLVTGPASTMPTVNTLSNGPVTNVPSTAPPINTMSGPVSNALLTGHVSGPMTNVSAMGLVSNVSTVSGLVSNSGPLFYPDALAKVVAPSQQIDETAVVESTVDSVMVETGPESSAGPIDVVTAAKDPTVALPNDGPLPVISAGPDSVAQNNDAPPVVLGKRGRGRPPKINGGPEKVWARPAMYIRKKGRRGRPKQVAIPGSTMSLRPRGRPRKNADDAIVSVDRANGGASGVLPGPKISWELPNMSLGLPNKDVPDKASLTPEILLMAYEGLKARAERHDVPDKASLTPEILLMAYEGLKARVERHFFLQQTRIKSSVSIVKPYVNETAVSALGALQDLEDFANIDVLSVLNGQSAGNVQGAPVEDSNGPLNGKDVSTGNIESPPPLTGASAQFTFQSTPTDAEAAQISFQGTIPVQEQQQEPPLQS